jgi:hypothetical protein
MMHGIREMLDFQTDRPMAKVVSGVKLHRRLGRPHLHDPATRRIMQTRGQL